MPHKVQVGDKFLLDAENGRTYVMTIKNVSEYRPPDMKYAVDVIDCKNNSYYKEYGDFWFCGDELINKCEKIGGDTDERQT